MIERDSSYEWQSEIPNRAGWHLMGVVTHSLPFRGWTIAPKWKRSVETKE